MVLGVVVFAVGWSMIGVSWFLPSSTMFWDLLLTGRFITGLSGGWSNATHNARFQTCAHTIIAFICIHIHIMS